MRKIIYLTVTLLLVFVLASCSDQNAGTNGVSGASGSGEKKEGIEGQAEMQEKGEAETRKNKDEIAERKGDTTGNQSAENERSENQNTENQSADNSSSGSNNAKTTHSTYKNDPNQEVIIIREKMFVAQTNDIYLNAKDYLGKKIKYEGMFKAYTDPRTNNTYYSVIRYGPGCCGTDMNCGFEVIWLDEEAEYPEDNAWVEVEGILGFVENENGYKFLRLDLTGLKVLEKRGQETVLQ